MTFVHSETQLFVDGDERVHVSFTLSRQQQNCPDMNRTSACEHPTRVCKQEKSAVNFNKSSVYFSKNTNLQLKSQDFITKDLLFTFKNNKSIKET